MVNSSKAKNCNHPHNKIMFDKKRLAKKAHEYHVLSPNCLGYLIMYHKNYDLKYIKKKNFFFLIQQIINYKSTRQLQLFYSHQCSHIVARTLLTRKVF